MALSDIADLAAHPAFVRRVRAAAIKFAVSVGNETYDGSSYKIMRRGLATAVLKDPRAWGEVFAWAVAANPEVTVNSADDAIEWTIGTVWDPIAGAYQEAQSAA